MIDYSPNAEFLSVEYRKFLPFPASDSSHPYHRSLLVTNVSTLQIREISAVRVLLVPAVMVSELPSARGYILLER